MIKRATRRHAFRFKVPTINGQTQTIVAWAKVHKAKKPVQLELSAEHVRRSMALDGVGNTQTCSMAVCSMDQAQRFPHAVVGYIDWQYSTCYVVSKISKETGLPSECWAYRHQDNVAKLNDTKGGQRWLLNQLKRHGDRTVRLGPAQIKKPIPGRPSGGRDGSRTSRPAPVGARLRFAAAQLGGVG